MNVFTFYDDDKDDKDDEENDLTSEEFKPLISQETEVYTIHDLTTSSGMSKVRGCKGLFMKALNYFCFRNEEDSYVDYVMRQCNSKTIQKEMKTIQDLLLNVNDWASIISNEEAIYIKDMQECESDLFKEREKYTFNSSQGLPTAQTLNNIETLAKRREIMFRHLSGYIRPLCVVIEKYKSKISENIINASFVRTAEGATQASHDAETLKKRLLNAREKYRIEKPIKLENEEVDIDTQTFVTNFLDTGQMRDEPKFFQ